MPYEAISAFDIFKVGIGPSSSHTLGPWRAASLFAEELRQSHPDDFPEKIKITLYGSLAKTGKGHGTDIAVMMGLSGADPVTIPVEEVPLTIAAIQQSRTLRLWGDRPLSFDPAADIIFLASESLPFHPNALRFNARLGKGAEVEATYYSIGGGFVVTGQQENNARLSPELPFPIDKADDLLHWCRKTGLSISEVVMENELSWRPEQEIRNGLFNIWSVMKACIYRGCHSEGVLPGGLQVKRRAAAMNRKLLGHGVYSDYEGWLAAIRSGGQDFNSTLDWVSCFALAVNEENASFGRVVTAPTNGAAGVIPAVLHYFVCFCPEYSEDRLLAFLLTAAEIGSIFKKGATISAAMGGCQAEIGVSSAMAAAGLTEALGGSQRQALMAAEIAMEHHLGLTCDPIGGLVQVPCIERNTMGAIKAITASRLALRSTPDFARVSLDNVIRTMWDTARDMDTKYKETAEGGLAVHIPLSLPEC